MSVTIRRGISVGGIGANRKMFGQAVAADHLSHTLLPENAFCRGLPGTGWQLADELTELVALHDASNIAAVIVEQIDSLLTALAETLRELA